MSPQLIASGDPGTRRWALYGTTLASDFPFTHHLAPATGPPEVTFDHRPGRAQGWEDETPVWTSSLLAASGEPVCVLLRRDGRDLLRFEGEADFLLAGPRIAGWLHDPAHIPEAELRLLGPVLAFWLENRGLPALHASAVSLEAGGGGRAVAFLAGHGNGKSLLAAAMMAEAGLPLLADDVVAVEPAGGAFLARPAYPQMRLAPDDARRLTGRSDLPPVLAGLPKRLVPVGVPGGFGAFGPSALPLAGIYLPVRGAPELAITPVAPAEALLALVEHSFAARLVAGAGLQPRRLATLARLVEAVPVRRLAYPSGRRHLPAVVRAVLADLQRR